MSMDKRKIYDDDDGRTIADMSDLTRPSLLGSPRGVSKRREMSEPSQERRYPWEEEAEPFTREERRLYVFAALKASLLIAAVFIVGLGLAILAMIWMWT